MAPEETKRRNRTQKSCQPCRVGKLKCDRELPCGECVKRLREPSCIYVQQVQDSLAYRQQSKQMRQKLENLERIVKGFRDGSSAQGSSTSVSTPSHKDIQQAPGSLRITNEEETFVGPAHWESIVNEIAEVKAHLDAQPEPFESPDGASYDDGSPSSDLNTPDLFFGRAVMTLQDLIAALPTKSVCDRLVSAWFNTMDNYKHIVHIPTFQQQYSHFWSNHSAATPVWLALLFNILALGTQYLSRTPPADGAPNPGAHLHALAAHALVLADYSKPKMYILEALVLYIRFGQTQADTSELKLWLTLGLVTRLATRMGIFRDAGTSQDILPFVAEMRRRLWLCICYMDIIFSYHIGLVSVIKGLPANTLPPSNLNDSDFGPDSLTLPPAWPMEKRTDMTYIITLGEMTNIFAETVTASNALVPPSDAEVARLEEKIIRIGERMPETLKMRPLDASFGDPPSLIMERFRLNAVYTKNMCVLFRRYLRSTQYEFRRKCIDAATKILESHRVLAEAVQPTGQLESCHYQEVRDLMDCFILAGIITAVELSDPDREACYSAAQLDSMTQLLLVSCNVWTTWSYAPRKARRAADAMKRMLDKHAASSSTSGAAAILEDSTLPSVGTGVQALDLNPGFDMAAAASTNLPDLSQFPFDGALTDQGMNWGMWDSVINTGDLQDPSLFSFQPDDTMSNGQYPFM